MENIKKNPILMAVLNFFGTGILCFGVMFIWSLIDKSETFAEKAGHPVFIILVAAVSAFSAVQSYLKVKKANEKDKQ